MDSNAKKMLWNMAGTAGLLMGLISTASMFIGQAMSTTQMPAFAVSVIGFILWAAETGGCIYLMQLYMKKFAAACPEADNRATFRMGMATALLSALVYSAASFANMAFISADYYAEQFEMMMQQMAPMMDSNTATVMDNMLSSMPQITFISNLIYCFLFGTVVSAILSRNIPSRDPFADYKPDQQ